MYKVSEIYDYINSIAPFNTQEEWDNSGLLVGDLNGNVTKIAVALDITQAAITTAKKLGAELIVSHHPVIFKAQKQFRVGNLAYELAAAGISALCAHTNLDAAEGGVSDVLAQRLAFTIFSPYPCRTPPCRCSEWERLRTFPMQPSEFAQSVKEKLNCTMVRYVAGRQAVRSVVVCGGAGCSLLDEAISLGADAFVTGDASHHDFLNAAEAGITLVAAGHFNTEDVVIEPLAKKLAENFREAKIIRLMQKDPVSYAI